MALIPPVTKRSAAWHWKAGDSLLHILPVAHIHGLVCGLLYTMAVGASCELLASFRTERAWEQLATGKFILLTVVATICQYMLAPCKRTACLSLLERLPKTTAGKIDKQNLKRNLTVAPKTSFHC